MNYNPIGRYISMTNRNMNYYYNKCLRKYRIKMNHLHLLHHIYYNEGISQIELGKKMKIDKITITKLLDKLVEEGYVVRKSSNQDKRVNNLYLTENGKSLQGVLANLIIEVNEFMLDGFEEQEIDLIRNYLQRISENIYNASRYSEK